MDYVISASYGNDSMAMMQWAHEHGLQNVTVAYCDTGWASPWWRDCRVSDGEAVAARLGFAVVRIPSMGMEALVKMKKGFPYHGAQFCTAWLKGLPFLTWIDDADPKCNAVVMIGKRRDESEGRKNTPEWVESSEYHGGRKVWHPLYLHSDDDRDALLLRAGIEKLPHRSDECSPCVNANRSDLRRVSGYQVSRIAALELATGQPMFRAEKHAGAQGIREVVTWARYSPGQYNEKMEDLFITGCGSPFGCGT
ncbi:MAG: phosphoadenosine phosphosulfate reductase family protein [Proteobacteria bacterium]|nr:phosphoadenosine phosphosulfate reductase family protein [Pseudomonadota bacterium]